MTVNKADLVKALAKRLGSRAAAVEAVDGVFDVIVREVARGGKVSITGFGTFERAERAARTGRNPHTGESVRIAPGQSPRFRAGTAFKDYVLAPETVPEDALAMGRAAPGTAKTAKKAKKAGPRAT